MTIGADMFNGTFPWDASGYLDGILIRERSQPAQNYPEQSYLIHDSEYYGYEAYDYQNPALFQSRGLITYSTLDPTYGLVSDTPTDIMTNISRTQNTTLEK